jgi:hypothetical protein
MATKKFVAEQQGPKNAGVTPRPEDNDTTPGYIPDGKEKKVWDQFKRRKQELLNSRRNIDGIDIDQTMRRMNMEYFNRIADIPASELDPDQRPVAINNAFGKIQSALSLLISNNPDFTMNNTNSKFAANKQFIRSLAKQSWENTNSIGQFKLSVFNNAKYGWFVGRTFNRKLIMDARFLDEVDEKGKVKETKKEITKIDDIMYMNMDPRNCWLDEETRPEDFYSTRDWMWREVWHIDKIKQLFPEDRYPNMKYVKRGGNTQETIEPANSQTQSGTATTTTQQRQMKRGMTEIFFYENQFDDWFIVEINGVMVCWGPLPQDNKRLSCTYGYWNLRNAQTVYGIGVIESMERNEQLIDRILNATMRQLIMSINPGGFYSGTEDMEDDNVKILPGVFRRTLDPDKVKWLQVPGINQTPFNALEYLENKEDAITGISASLEGDPSNGKTSDTAYGLGLDREASLKKLQLPLKSLQMALKWELENHIAMIQQTYSDFEVEHIADPDDIQAYLDEVKGDPDFYFIENQGKSGKEIFWKKNFKQAALKLDQDDNGSFIDSDTEKFFHIMPSKLAWSGSVTVDIDSILVTSEVLEQQNTLRLVNLLLPMFQMDPAVALKPAKQLLASFKKDPNSWLPAAWLQAQPQAAVQQQPPAGGGAGGGAPAGAPGVTAPAAPTLTNPGQETAGGPTLPKNISPVLKAQAQ